MSELVTEQNSTPLMTIVLKIRKFTLIIEMLLVFKDFYDVKNLWLIQFLIHLVRYDSFEDNFPYKVDIEIAQTQISLDIFDTKYLLLILMFNYL